MQKDNLLEVYRLLLRLAEQKKADDLKPVKVSKSAALNTGKHQTSKGDFSTAPSELEIGSLK